MKSTPSNKGGLPAIPAYEIERHYFLHEIRNLRAKRRVHGVGVEHETRYLQRLLCKSRKDYYVKKH